MPPLFCLTVGERELDTPHIVKAMFSTAYQTGLHYKLRAEDWLPFLAEELYAFRGIFLNAQHHEVFPNITDIFGVEEENIYAANDNTDPHHRSVTAFFERYCGAPLQYPPELRGKERDYAALLGTVLRAFCPQDAALWHLAADNDNHL